MRLATRLAPALAAAALVACSDSTSAPIISDPTDASLIRIDHMIPVGGIGVIPTKVSADNGSIHRGDLLVTAATPGHTMRGTNRGRMLGAVVGKALAEFTGPGTGAIRVLVTVR